MSRHIFENKCKTFGSVLGLFLIDIDYVLSIPAAAENYITSEILLSADLGTCGIGFIPETCGFSEKSKQTGHGRIWEKKIVFDVSKRTPEINSWIRDYSDKKFIAILKDGNSMINIVGSLDFPLRFKNINSEIGTKMPNGTSYDFELVVSEMNQSYFYMMFEPLPDGSRKIFDNTFDFTFE